MGNIGDALQSLILSALRHYPHAVNSRVFFLSSFSFSVRIGGQGAPVRLGLSVSRVQGWVFSLLSVDAKQEFPISAFSLIVCLFCCSLMILLSILHKKTSALCTILTNFIFCVDILQALVYTSNRRVVPKHKRKEC